MDFIGGALPNVMFLIGVIAIGIGLGLEFKIIEVKNGLSRGGRIGACLVGIALVATSIALYLRPPQTASSTAQLAAAAPNTSPTQAQTAPTSSPEQAAASQAPTAVPTALPTAVPTVVPTELPTAVPTVVPTAAPTTAPTDAPTATPTSAPTRTPAPTSTSTPQPTAIPTVVMPDIRGMSPKDAEKLLKQLGLALGERQPSCEELGVDADLVIEARKDHIACQSLAPGSSAALGSVITYAFSDAKED